MGTAPRVFVLRFPTVPSLVYMTEAGLDDSQSRTPASSLSTRARNRAGWHPL